MYFNGLRLPYRDSIKSDKRCFYCLEVNKIILYQLKAKYVMKSVRLETNFILSDDTTY